MQRLSLRRCSAGVRCRRYLGAKPLPALQRPAGRTSARGLIVQRWPVCIVTSRLSRCPGRTQAQADATPAVGLEMEELQKLVALLPDRVRTQLESHPDLLALVEVVMDLGRPPLARFPHGDVQLSGAAVTSEDLDQAVEQVGDFSGDNRAGIDGTLHRISCMRNRSGRIVGLTCRVGRVIEGSAAMVEDFIRGSRSILLLGRPGVGKTTAIRDISCMLADKLRKRTVIVDTSNEIGGDGDVPHPGIGDARRMQVPCPEEQHRVMQEAVENHMPQAIIIDEIGTEAECMAARTISQRGLQLVATAHGNALENVIKNPALNLLVGGIQSVTLGDDAAKRRGVQKSILERAGPPTFDVCVEMIDRHRWRVHPDVGLAVDAILAGGEPVSQMRERDPISGQVRDVAFKGVVRRSNERGEMQSMEVWMASDGEEIARPITQSETRQALPFPSLRPPSPVGSSRSGSATPADSETSAQAARRPAPKTSPLQEPAWAATETSPPLRRPLPSMLQVPESPVLPRPTAGNLGSTTGQAKAAAAAARAAAMAAAKADVPPSAPAPLPAAVSTDAALVAQVQSTIAQLTTPVIQPPPESWPESDPAAAPTRPAVAPASAQAQSFPDPAAATPGPASRPAAAAAAWPSTAAAAASLPAVMPAPVLDTKSVLASAAAARGTGAPSSSAPALPTASPATSSPPPAPAPSMPVQDLTAPSAPSPAPLLSRSGSGGPAATMLVYLLMDDEHAVQVHEVLAALADKSVVVTTQDLTAAHIVITTRSKLRSSPKMKSVVRKLGKPIYTVRATSAASIARELCPLLGINPQAAGAVSAYAATASGSGSSSSGTSGGAGSPELELLEAGSSLDEDDAPVAPLDGKDRADCSSADDYADLLESSVRELRYAPIDRDYSAQTLDRFLQELGGAGQGGSGCKASSLASMVWALGHTKHKRKFVEAKRDALLQLAAHCQGRWNEFSSRDLLRIAKGMAGLRLAPSTEWVEQLAARYRAGMTAGEFSVEQIEQLSAAVYTLEALPVNEFEPAV